jgi:hypothetical protein
MTLYATRKANPRATAMQTVQTVPAPNLSASPSSATPVAGNTPITSPQAMKKGGKVAGKLAKRGYGKVR